MTIQYKIKGVTLDVGDLISIHKYYEAACTAEHLMNNYDIEDENKAMQLGYDVRRLMDKYGYDEEEAIQEILSNYGDEDDDDDEEDEE